jgi:hypothetical protein
VSYAAEADLSDLDGDCAEEEPAAEITALARAEVESAVTAEHQLVAGEVVEATVTSFELVEPLVCDQTTIETDEADEPDQH